MCTGTNITRSFLVFGLACFLVARPSIVSADPLGAGDGAIYRLDPDSAFQEGCFPPCMCPIMDLRGLRGTFKLTYLGHDAGIESYVVSDINWSVRRDGAEMRVFGSGIYRLGSPDPINLLQHRLELDLQVGDQPVTHFDSRWAPVEDLLHLGITVSINGLYCFDTAFVINAQRVPDDQITSYELRNGSTFQRGCWDPCDCLLGPEIPMVGRFKLVAMPQSSTTPVREYAVVGVDWHVLANSAADALPIGGLGFYRVDGDLIEQHQLGLDLVVGAEPRAHFDSGLVPSGSIFPAIDALISINGMECMDTVLHVVAAPAGTRVCGGIAGLPCESGEFCKLPVGGCCCDYLGICVPIPGPGVACPDVWAPVCGCDGVTYGNECEADRASMSIDHYGACGAHCGSDADCTAANEFCKFAEGSCGDAVNFGLGSCTPRPDVCPDFWDPVCGCDGVTYGNECEADAAGASVLHHGACQVACEPLADGLGCALTSCSVIPEVSCMPSVLHLDVTTGAITTQACECQDVNICHIEFGNASPMAVGHCPDGAPCEVAGSDTDGDGVDDTFTATCRPIGACCTDISASLFSFPICDMVPEDACQPGVGYFQGPGTVCEPEEACCLNPNNAGGYCVGTSPICCRAFGGVPQGPGTLCGDATDPTICDHRCGGFAGQTCADGEFCKYPEGVCSDASDHEGVCTPIPPGCPDVWAPVCGCDGVTYGNECEADAVGVSVLRYGECAAGACCLDATPGTIPCMVTAPMDCRAMGGVYLGDNSACPTDPNMPCVDACGSVCPDGNACFTGCGTLIEGVECVLFQTADGSLFLLDNLGGFTVGDVVSVTGCAAPMCYTICQEGNGCIVHNTITSCEQHCGGIAGLPCDDGEFCKYPIGTCHIADRMGVCRPIELGCPRIFDPVCGCDGVTYVNECEADVAGASVDHYGECGSACCDPAQMPLCPLEPYCCSTGQWFCGQPTDPSLCPGPGQVCETVCGGPNAIPCPGPGDFCKMPTGVCDDTTVIGACVHPPSACPEYYDPVCGCDGLTYGNECFADAAGVSIAYHGMCHACAATRVVDTSPPTYCPGTVTTITVVLQPPAGAVAVAIEDGPPAGWSVSNISHGGTFDAVNRKVKWGPLFTPFPPELTYDVLPPAANANDRCFTGIISVDGANWSICGVECLTPYCCPEGPHLGPDTPRPPCFACPLGDCTTCDEDVCEDDHIGLCELVGYACAWKHGCEDDIGSVARAAYLWRNGECYCWDDGEQNFMPILCDAACCAGPGLGGAGGDIRAVSTVDGSATARLATSARGERRGGALTTISVQINAPTGTTAAALELHLPRGWKASDISDDGQWDAAHQKIKWGPFFDRLSRTVTVTVRGHAAKAAPAGRSLSQQVGIDGLGGTVSFDGVNQPVVID